jgi:hypothetical protein
MTHLHDDLDAPILNIGLRKLSVNLINGDVNSMLFMQAFKVFEGSLEQPVVKVLDL